MIQSNATKYAIRAVCHLAELPKGDFAQAKEISERLDIPYHYLSKILQELARKRFLKSSRGPGGGFRLNVSPETTVLQDLIEAVEGPTPEDECVLGLEICSDEAMCPMHEIWTHLRDNFRDRMERISLQDVVESSQLKRKYLEKLAD